MIILTIVLTVILAISYLAHAALLKNGAAGRVISMTAVYPVVTVLLSAMFFQRDHDTPINWWCVIYLCRTGFNLLKILEYLDTNKQCHVGAYARPFFKFKVLQKEWIICIWKN